MKAPGERFEKLSSSVAKEYGNTAKAKKIGAAVAAKVGREKYGKKGMEQRSARGREDAQGRRY